MNNKQIRLANLERLITECYPPTVAQFEIETGIKAGYVYQLRGDRGMGDQVARRIEIATGKPLGWMDEKHEDFENLEPKSQVDEIIADLSKLSPENLEAVQRLVRAAVKEASE